MRLSYSQLEWFLRCPYLYKYQFIDKHQIPRGKDALFGGLLHKVLEELYKRKPVIPTLTELLTFYEEDWQKGSLNSYFTSEIEANVHFKEGMRIVKDFYQSNDIAAAHILALEQFFNVPIQDQETGRTHTLSGRIDRIDKTKEGIEIIDYKTGRVLKSEKQISNDLQLSLYHLGVSFLWPKLVEKYHDRIWTALYFLRHGEKVMVKKTSEELSVTKDALLGYIRDIEEAIQTNTFEARPSALCAREPYARICPFFKDRYRDEKPKIQGKKEVARIIQEYDSLKREDKKVKVRLGELARIIHEYLDDQGLEGIYEKEKGIIRIQSPVYETDILLLKDILQELGKWEEVLEVSPKKVTIVMGQLPQEYQRRLRSTKKVKTISRSLRIKRS